MIARMILFGASGDLAGRFLLPALAALAARGELAEDFRLVGCAPKPWEDARFRRHAAQRLGEHAQEVEASVRDRLLDGLSYRQVDIKEGDAIAKLVREEAAALVAYMALPASLFPDAIRNFGAAGLPDGSRLVLEKPFGEDLASARMLNGLIADQFGSKAKDVLYRVDHLLGMSTVANLVGLRWGNRLFDGVWNGRDVAEIEILWEETLGLEGRAGFFDQTGTLRDVVQNHLMQLLAITAMEPPKDVSAPAAAKRDLLAAIPAVPADRIAVRTQRARYTAGWLADRRYVGDYADEAGVEPDRGTETFAEVQLTIENERWQGVRVRLRAGKALAKRRKGVILRFRPPEHEAQPDDVGADEVLIGIDGPRTTELHLAGTSSSDPYGGEPVVFEAPPPPTELEAYGNVLRDILSGGHKLSVSGGEAEEAWRILEPVIEAWRNDHSGPGSYEAGSNGPPPLPF
jgi:glucose-6-phosphate 1-dehydrogenase